MLTNEYTTAKFIVGSVPHIENQLHISWRHLGATRASALSNVTLQYMQEDASVPGTLENMSWGYEELEAYVPISAVFATVPRDSSARGTPMRFRVLASAGVSGKSFFGPWSSWVKIYPRYTPALEHTGVAYATSWKSNLVYVWELQRLHGGPGGLYNVSMIGKYSSKVTPLKSQLYGDIGKIMGH